MTKYKTNIDIREKKVASIDRCELRIIIESKNKEEMVRDIITGSMERTGFYDYPLTIDDEVWRDNNGKI